MAHPDKISALFLDIGGVLLTNGWDRIARQRAIEKFRLDEDEVNERHHLTFDTYEEGKLSLVQYLNRVIFYKERSFAMEEFRQFMFSQSQPYTEMIQFVQDLKDRYHLRLVVVSNEGRELNEYRIRTFKLNEFIDAFISSSFVHFRKPDEDMFRMALDISQVPPQEVVYIDDRLMFVQIAEGLGIKGIHHRDFQMTKLKLAETGLQSDN